MQMSIKIQCNLDNITLTNLLFVFKPGEVHIKLSKTDKKSDLERIRFTLVCYLKN